MVDITDSTQSFTVTLVVPPPPVPEGVAFISSLTFPQAAEAGSLVNITFDLNNDGGDDTLFAKATMESPLGTTTELFRGVIPSGGTVPVAFNIPMPNQNMTMRIDVGHEE